MKYMLDTNICIYAIKHKPPEVIRNFLKHDPDDMCISSITYGELMHGVEKSQSVERNRVAIIYWNFTLWCSSGRRVWKSSCRFGTQRYPHRSNGYVNCWARKVWRSYSCNKQHKRIFSRQRFGSWGLGKVILSEDNWRHSSKWFDGCFLFWRIRIRIHQEEQLSVLRESVVERHNHFIRNQ